LDAAPRKIWVSPESDLEASSVISLRLNTDSRLFYGRLAIYTTQNLLLRKDSYLNVASDPELNPKRVWWSEALQGGVGARAKVKREVQPNSDCIDIEMIS
jgi:hypothetical protein